MSQKQVEQGATILGRYRHPESWKDGAETGKSWLRGTKLLKVEEIRLGGGAFVTPQEARANREAIRAFTQARGIASHKLSFEQEHGKAPYVVVPSKFFEEVLAVLQTL